MVSAGEFQQRYGIKKQEITSKRALPGLVIGCIINTATGTLSFTVNGCEVANKFQVTVINCPASGIYVLRYYLLAIMQVNNQF